MSKPTKKRPGRSMTRRPKRKRTVSRTKKRKAANRTKGARVLPAAARRTVQHAQDAPERPAPALKMTRSVVELIRQTIGVRTAESGGMLGGSRSDGVIRHYHFDGTARRTGVAYSPDCQTLNALLQEEWNPAGINLLGFVHSHPPSIRRPSYGDERYAARILTANPELACLALPIVMTEPDTGRFTISAHVAVRNGGRPLIEERELVIVDDRVADRCTPSGRRDAGAPQQSPPAAVRRSRTSSSQVARAKTDLSQTFRRVRGAYDLKRLSACRVIYVGMGGAASYTEDNGRAGVGEHILIDPDVVSEANIATQQVYRKDIGRPKVDCVAERLADINPNARVLTIPKRFEELDDLELQRLATAPLWGERPVRTLLCLLTDQFEPQARGNRVALQLGLPSLSAQVYRQGRGGEITFTYPGVTPACHRCALRSRYQAYLAHGFSNDVTSDGTPIYATTRLNALKGMITMAILHHGTAHPRWSGLLRRIADRNLVQVRMDPDLADTLGLGVFDQVFGGGDTQRILFDDVVWLPQKPDCPKNGYPACPDCGGTGDLRRVVATIADTRVMRR